MKIRVSIVTSLRRVLPVKRYRRPASLAELRAIVKQSPIPGLSLEIGLWRTRWPDREPIDHKLQDQLVVMMKNVVKGWKPRPKVRGVLSTALGKFMVHARICDGPGTAVEIARAVVARSEIVARLRRAGIKEVEMTDNDGGIVWA